MNERLGLAALVLTWSATTMLGCVSAHSAEPAPGVVRLAVVDPGSPSTTPPNTKAFWERLHELGYIEGRNLVSELRWAEGRLDQLPALMADVVAHKVDVLVTW